MIVNRSLTGRLLAAVALAACCAADARPQPDPKAKDGFAIVPAAALTKAFADDPAAAGKKYGNFAPVAVEGVVARVAPDPKGGVTVFLKGDTDKVGVACVFEAKGGKDAAKLKVGAKVIIAGAGAGLKDKNFEITFCTLIPGGPPKADPGTTPDPKTPAPKNVPDPKAKADTLVKVDPKSGWAVAPAAVGAAAYTNRDYKIAKLPKELAGARLIRRAGGGEGDTGFLGGKVSVTKAATVYVAVMWEYNKERTVQEDALAAFAEEGWKEVPGAFELTTPPGEVWRWRVWSRAVPAGPIKLESKALPVGGIFFVKP